MTSRNNYESILNTYIGYTVDIVVLESEVCKIYLRKIDGERPEKLLELTGCFHFKDFGMINCKMAGFRVFDLGSYLFNVAEQKKLDPDSFHQLHLWSNVKSISKYASYEYTGITLAFQSLKMLDND